MAEIDFYSHLQIIIIVTPLISVKVHLQLLTTNFFSAGSLIGLFIHLKTGRNYFNAVVQGIFEGVLFDEYPQKPYVY